MMLLSTAPGLWWGPYPMGLSLLLETSTERPVDQSGWDHSRITASTIGFSRTREACGERLVCLGQGPVWMTVSSLRKEA